MGVQGRLVVAGIEMLVPEATQVKIPGHGLMTLQIEVVWGRITSVEPLGQGAGVHLASHAAAAVGAGVINGSAMPCTAPQRATTTVRGTRVENIE